MQIKWGKNNESLTLTVGAGGHFKCEDVFINFDKMTLQLIDKMVCDTHYLKQNMAKRVNIAELELKCLEADLEKGKNLWRAIWRFIKFPVSY